MEPGEALARLLREEFLERCAEDLGESGQLFRAEEPPAEFDIGDDVARDVPSGALAFGGQLLLRQLGGGSKPDDFPAANIQAGRLHA